MALPQILGVVSMFNMSKKGGYEVEEVNDFLARQKQETTKIISGLRGINDNLRRENEELLNELNEYRKRDLSTVSQATIEDAKRQAEEIIKASQDTFLLEVQKVQKVYEELVDTIKYAELKYGIETDDKLILTRFKTQIKKILYDCLDKEEPAHETVAHISDKARLSVDLNKTSSLAPKVQQTPIFSEEQDIAKMTDSLNVAIWHESETERLNRLKTKEFKTASQWLDEKQASDKIETSGDFSENKEKLRLGRTFTNTKVYGREPSFEEVALDAREKHIAANTETKQDAYARLINKYLKKPMSETTFIDTDKRAEEKIAASVSGFNMRDALVNKQSLDEIMQSFDFYTGSESEDTNW